MREWNLADDVDELTELLYRQHDVVSLRQANRHLTRATLRNRVESGRWQQVHAGVLCAHNGPLTDTQRLWVASLAAGDGRAALLGGRTALAVLGLKGFAPDRIHVLLPASRKEMDPPPGVAVHRTRALPAADIQPHGSPPTTTAARSMVDAASWARSDREAMTVVAMGFQQRLVGLADLSDVLGRLPRAKRRRLTWTMAVDAAGGAESLGELDLTRLLRAAKLPEPTRQKVRVDPAGRRRYLDAYFDDWALHVEIDGAHHLDAAQWWLDSDRQNQLWLRGDRVLRFPAWLVRDQPDKVGRDIAECVG